MLPAYKFIRAIVIYVPLSLTVTDQVVKSTTTSIFELLASSEFMTSSSTTRCSEERTDAALIALDTVLSSLLILR